MWLRNERETQDTAFTISLNVIISTIQDFNKDSSSVNRALLFDFPDFRDLWWVNVYSLQITQSMLLWYNRKQTKKNCHIFFSDFCGFYLDICSQICYPFVFFWLCLSVYSWTLLTFTWVFHFYHWVSLLTWSIYPKYWIKISEDVDILMFIAASLVVDKEWKEA